MRFRMRRLLVALLVSCASVLNPPMMWAQPASNPAPNFGVAKETVFWATFCIMTAVLVFAFLFVTLGLLRSRDWQLGDAISEEAGNQPNPLPAGTKPIMVASSSRLIALIGLLNILGVFLGFGYYFLYTAFAGTTMQLADMKPVIYYLFSGAVMFAPYLANQLRDAFTSFGAAPQSSATPAPAQAPATPVLVRGIGVG